VSSLSVLVWKMNTCSVYGLMLMFAGFPLCPVIHSWPWNSLKF